MKKDGHPSPSNVEFPPRLQFEVKNVYNLEIHTVHQNNVTSDHHVRAIRRWRGQPAFKILRTGIHPAPQLYWKYAPYYKPSF